MKCQRILFEIKGKVKDTTSEIENLKIKFVSSNATQVFLFFFSFLSFPCYFALSFFLHARFFPLSFSFSCRFSVIPSIISTEKREVPPDNFISEVKTFSSKKVGPYFLFFILDFFFYYWKPSK